MSPLVILIWSAFYLVIMRDEVFMRKPKALCAAEPDGPDELELRFVESMRIAVVHGRLDLEDMRELVEVLDIPLVNDLMPVPPDLRPFVCPPLVDGGLSAAEAFCKWRHYILVNHIQHERALEKWKERNPSYVLSVSRWYQLGTAKRDEKPTQTA